MNRMYFQCNDITTAEGAKYIKCVVGVDEIQPSGNAALDRQTIRDNVMSELESCLAVDVESFASMEELAWE